MSCESSSGNTTSAVALNPPGQHTTSSRMVQRVRHYRLLIGSLGLWQFLFYKLQQLRVRFLHITRPISLRTKLARFPLQFRPLTSDHAVFFQIFVRQEYRCLLEIPDPNLIIDCGANVGYSSAYFLSRFPNAFVIAVEPDSENLALLKANLSPFTGRYHVLCSAVWSHETRLTFSGLSRPGDEWSRQVKPAIDAQPTTISATDIGTLLKQSGYQRISILKIDIEGSEAAVFSANYENWISKVDNLLIELHGDDCRAIFENAIAAQNFVVSQCDELIVCRRS